MPFNSFKQFTKLYEADSSPASAPEGSFPPEADLILSNISQLGFSILWYLNMMVPDYKETVADIESLINAPDKAAKLSEITSKIKDKIQNKEFIQAGIPDLFLQSAQKNAEAFKKFVDVYCQTEEGKESMREFIEDRIEGYLKFLEETGKKMMQKTGSEAASKNEHVRWHFTESLNENELKKRMLQGNRGFIRMLTKEATLIASDLKLAKEGTPSKASDIGNLETRLNAILAELARLSVEKRANVAQDKLDELAEELSSIPEQLIEIQKSAQNEVQKGSKNWDISSIHLQALDLYQKALEKYNAIKPAPSEVQSATGTDSKPKAQEISQIKMIKPGDLEVKGKVNPDVQKFQEFVILIFSDSDIADDALFQKFKGYGADGKFGPTTQNMVKALKSAFDMDSETPNISMDLIRELMDYAREKKLMESESVTAERVLGFDSFCTLLAEAFDAGRFKEASKRYFGSTGSGSTSSGNRNNILSLLPSQIMEEWKDKLLISTLDETDYADEEKYQKVDPKKFNKDVRDFQRLMLNFVEKFHKDADSNAVDKSYYPFESEDIMKGWGSDGPMIVKFFDSKPDGGFGKNTMAAIRFVRTVLDWCLKNTKFREKFKEEDFEKEPEHTPKQVSEKVTVQLTSTPTKGGEADLDGGEADLKNEPSFFNLFSCAMTPNLAAAMQLYLTSSKDEVKRDNSD